MSSLLARSVLSRVGVGAAAESYWIRRDAVLPVLEGTLPGAEFMADQAATFMVQREVQPVVRAKDNG